MNKHLELVLRSLGVFLGIFFTLGWAMNKNTEVEYFTIIFSIVAAVTARTIVES